MVKRNENGRFIKGSSNIPIKDKKKFSKTRSKVQKQLWKDEKYKKKMSISRKGRVAWNKNKKMPEISGKNNGNWKDGISNDPYSVDWTETLKRSIRERDHYICQLCSKYGNAVHHIDYNKQNCNPNNLVTLCIGCNSRVNANRNYWFDYFKLKLNLRT